MRSLLLFTLIFSCFIFQYQSKISYEIVGEFSLEEEANWKVQGNAEITNEATAVLVKDEKVAGMITALKNINFEENDFQISIAFAVDVTKERGDGMALWFTESPLQPGDMFGGPRMWNGAAIVLDTVIDNPRTVVKTPTVSIHRNDGTIISKFETDGDNTLASYCMIPLRGNIMRINVHYSDGILSVFTDVEGKNQRKECASFPIHLRNNYYFSLSASNFQSTGKFSIYSVEVQKMFKEADDEVAVGSNRKVLSDDIANQIRDVTEKTKKSYETVARINNLRTSLYLTLDSFNSVIVKYTNDSASRLPTIQSILSSSFEYAADVRKEQEGQEAYLLILGESLIPSIREQLKGRKTKIDMLVRDIDSSLLSIDNHLTVSSDRIRKLKFGNDVDDLGHLEIPGFISFIAFFTPIVSIAGCAVWFCRKGKTSNKSEKRSY